MPARGAAPEAAIVLCPDCGEDQVHDVLQAAGSGAGAQHATVRCRECSRVHRTVLEPAKLVPLPIIISKQEASERLEVELPDDDVIAVDDELVAAGQQVKVRGIDRKDGKRVRRAAVKDIATLWAVHFEEIVVKFSVNMGERTISKSVPVSPRDSFTVGDELDLDRLRIYIKSIHTTKGSIDRGSAEASEISRIFASPVRLTPEQRRERRQELGLPPPKPRRRWTKADGPRKPSVPTSRPKAQPRPPPRGGARRPSPRGAGPAGGSGSGPKRPPRKGPPRSGGDRRRGD